MMCISNSNTVKLLKLKPKGEYAEGSKKKQLVQGIGVTQLTLP